MSQSPLDAFREQLDALDSRIIELLAERLEICKNVARYKKSAAIPMMQPGRVQVVKQRVAERAQQRGVNPEFVQELYGLIIGEACRLEDEIIDNDGEAPPGKQAAHHAQPATDGGATALICRAVIVGSNGRMGQTLARKLMESGVSIVGVDLQDVAEDPAMAEHYLQCDARELSPQGQEHLGQSDLVVICLPEDAAIPSMPGIVRAARRDALLLDTLSVKGRIVDLLGQLRPTQEYISINPMFAPQVGFLRQNVAVVAVNRGPRATAFLELITSWGARVVELEPAEHDRLLALVQGLTHAALMAMGLVLHDWGYDVERALPVSTPPHRVALALLARMADIAPEVYWDIQHSNTYCADARRSLAEQMRRLSDIVEAGSEEQFAAAIAEIGQVLDPVREKLLRLSAALNTAGTL
jgi:prephenate dehydrogenase